MNNEMIFADGMTFKEAHKKAPESVRGAIYFHADKFIAFLNAHKNERGFVNTKMMKSARTGGIYFILDEWKKPDNLKTEEEKANFTEQELAQISALRGDTPAKLEYPKEEISADSIPF